MSFFSSLFSTMAVPEKPQPPRRKTFYTITIGEKKIIASRYWVYPSSGLLGWETPDGGGGSAHGPYLVESYTEDEQQ